jgi:fibronectin-binding autotransporter adhesin
MRLSKSRQRENRPRASWPGLLPLGLAALALPSRAQPVTGTWVRNDNGNWNDPSNWTGGVPGTGGNTPTGTDDVANFLNAITGSRTINFNAPQRIGNLHFDNASAYTLNGAATLSFRSSTEGATLLVTAANGIRSHVVNVPLRLESSLGVSVASAGASVQLNKGISDDGNARGITIDGPGTVMLGGSGNNTYGGATLVKSGRLLLDRSGIAIPGPLFIGNGASPATVAYGGRVENIADDAEVIVAGGISSPTNAAVFDLTNGLETIGSLSGGGIVKGTNLWIAGGKSATFSGEFQFGDIYKTGPSTLTLRGGNNHFVIFQLTGGTLVLGSDGAMRTGKLFINDPLSALPGTNKGSGNVVIRATSPALDEQCG